MGSIPALILDPDNRQPLVQQIYTALSQQIRSRVITPLTRLPATRNLAKELGVSRSTVVQAYEQLAAEGFVEARQGSGYFACDVGDVEELYAPSRPGFAPLDRLVYEAALEHHQFPGLPDMRLFPHAAWAKHVARSARQSAQSMLSTGDRFGLTRLRSAIAHHLSTWRGVDAAPEQIVITAGAADALEIALRTLACRPSSIALENPTYPPLYRMADNMGLHPVWMEIGQAGAELPAAGSRPAVTVLTPSYQFPLGGAMTRSRRLAFLERAEMDDGWIIEDDFDSEFRYAGRPIPALASLDRSQRVIYIGSFSKIFSSSLRIGYMVVPQHLLPEFRRTITEFGQRASVVPQWPIATFIEDGSFHRHIRRMRRIYGERRQVFVDRLREDLPPSVGFVDHRAGMQIALHFPAHWDDRFISEEAAASGVNCLPLSSFYHQSPVRSGLLIGFSTVAPAEADRPIDALLSILGSP